MIRLARLSILMTLFALTVVPSALSNSTLHDASADYACHFNICDGDTVTVVSGIYLGMTGFAQNVNSQTGNFNLVTAFEGTFFMHSSLVQRGYFPPSCLYGFCIGNRTLVVNGSFKGLVSWVDGFRPGRQMVKTQDRTGRQYIIYPANLRHY